jgi:hypothetical protein
LGGDDLNSVARKKAQQEQMKLWSAKSLLMTKKSLDDEKRAEREYANFILDQDKIHWNSRRRQL